MTPSASKQAAAWRGEFGDAYVSRNQPAEEVLTQRARAFAEILGRIPGGQPDSIFEAGCNLGLNLRALRRVTTARLSGLEPNARARRQLLADAVLESDQLFDGTLDRIPLPDGAVDLAFTAGVLIHVPPAGLERACAELHRVARRHILCIEYFAVSPESVRYQGETDLLFKRDFGGYWLDRYPRLETLGTGFLWKRTTGWDNTTWWLFRKP